MIALHFSKVDNWAGDHLRVVCPCLSKVGGQAFRNWKSKWLLARKKARVFSAFYLIPTIKRKSSEDIPTRLRSNLHT
jgi:hypothetical protein